jgi:hypothetical protein
MARVTATQAADKLIKRLTQATADVTAGVEQVTVAPGLAAAEAADLMLIRLTESITSGRWAQAVGSVTLQEWRTAMLKKGVPRIAAGIQASKGKLEKFYAQLLPAVDSAVATIDAMPRTTLEDRINRSSQFQRIMSEFKFQK